MASSSTAGQKQTQPENTFDEIAPYSAPKSTEPWDIFINHRGCDVKHTLATTIYDKLHSIGLHVFLDKDALEVGDSIPAEIHHAITSATLLIAIFSPHYAQSSWCLAELSSMLKTGKKIIPIFYHVEPSDLRWIEKGKYATAFSDHKQKGRYKSEKVDEWKGALYDISFLSGHLVNNNGDEATVLKTIVTCALKIMTKCPLWVAEHPVGLDELVEDFESVASEEKVKVTGIVGMGGSGKTTLAKELFNSNFSSFGRCSFVSDVRDAASRNALCDKQRKLLKDLGADDMEFDNVDEGKVVLANRLSSHRALIVLDDVDHIDQLNALLPNKDNLGSHSMVIVTTRELGVLISWDLSCIYRMPGLNTSHAEQLFCWHAFLQPSPPAGFETLVHEFLKACNGLSLSLKVIGAQLYGRKSKDYWKSLLHKILRILPGEIKQRLQASYDALDEEEREMFLDVACFLIGQEEHRAIAVWDGSGWSGLHGLETLVNKCLVELVEERQVEVIRMHDQLRDMGREIASRHSPYRLWCPQKIVNMKKHSTDDRKQIRGIRPADAFVAFKEYTHQSIGNSIRPSKHLRFSIGLQILSVKGNEFTEEFASLSEDLVWLCWKDFPLRFIPSWLILKNLRILQLCGAPELEELWQDNADLPLQLRELILWDCPKFQRPPSSIKHLHDLQRLKFHRSGFSDEWCDLHSLEYLQIVIDELSSLPACFGNLTSLRNIRLPYCMKLSTLPDSFSQLIHLEDLDLCYCKKLSSLPPGFGNLPSLRNIRLQNCKKLSTLPDSFSQLIHLEDLDLFYCEKLSSLPPGFGNLTNLRNIRLQNCKKLSTLPDSFSQLIHLEDLDLCYCEKLSSLPPGFGNLTSLRNIRLERCKKLSTLPDSFIQLIHLEDLNLMSCVMLSSLPAGFGNLTSLRNIRLMYCIRLSTLPDSFSQLIHLEDLDLFYCKKLSSLPAGFGNLTSLRNIRLQHCMKLSTLPDSFSQLIHPTTVDLFNCEMLSLLPETLPVSLHKLRIFSNNFLKNVRCISGLINLETLKICNCEELEEFPSLSGLASLTRFEMWNCPKVEKIEGLEHAKSLKILNVQTCWEVPGIQSLENVERLEELKLKCNSIPALKPCIESIKGKECPRMMGIQVSVNISVDLFDVISLEFPDLEVTEMEKLRYVDKKDLIAFLCYVEEDDEVRAYYFDYVYYLGRDFSCEDDAFGDNVGDVDFLTNDELDVFDLDFESYLHHIPNITLRSRANITLGSRVMWGIRERVADAFHQLLKLLE